MYSIRKLADFRKFVLVSPTMKVAYEAVFDPEIPGSEERAHSEIEQRCEQMNTCWNRTYQKPQEVHS